jgi:predicted enzyme related to lactoylglutathione lyase
MTVRDTAPLGAPCWTDLWTSDVEGSRRFYAELLGWEAQEPNAEFGGYWMFTRAGVPVAGGMGPMGDIEPSNSWTPYLAVADIAKTMDAAAAAGATVAVPPMPVADMGIQSVFDDPTGAHLGAWQPGTFAGFTVIGEAGAPSWFELFTRDHAASLSFYQSVFGWKTETIGDSDEFRYAVMKNPDGEGELAGIMDASAFLPEGVPAHWSVYWEVDDIDATAARVEKLGGTIVSAPETTPYGRLGTATDPSGAQFKLRTGPR